MGVVCPQCRTGNPSDAKYCKECAAPLPASRGLGLSQTKTLETPAEQGLPRGTIIAGRYEVIEELGRGGMGKVYEVFDRETDSHVALKMIRPEVAADGRTIERFKNELRIARGISHKHVCRMYDLGREADGFFITMEYVPGEDLKSLIRKTRRLDVATAVAIAKEVCEGLAEAHRLGVVHRDLKPGNIMIDLEGEAKIMDFGIARSLRSKGMTGPGAAIGTPEYMSPEQVDGKEADQRADLYSLGIILYEMVTGTVPFDGETSFAVGLKHKSEPPEDPKRLNPQIPDALGRLILKSLEKDREVRHQTAAEVLSELTRIEQGLPAPEKAAPGPKPSAAKEITVKLSLRRLAVPAVAVAAVAAGAVLFVLLSKRQPPAMPAVPSHKQLTFLGDATSPAISPDGKFIAYVSGGQGQRVWVQDTASGRSIEVFGADQCANLLWIPDGSEISVWAREGTQSGSFLVPRLGGSPRRIGLRPDAWSPDGSRYLSLGQPRNGRIAVRNVDKATGNSTSFDLAGPFLFARGVDWSPAGDRVLIQAVDDKNIHSLWTARPDGGQQKMVAEDSVPLSSPRWASQGDAIFYLRGDGPSQRELWKLPVSRDDGSAAGSASRVLSGIAAGGSFTLSADGRCLLYTREARFSNLWLAKDEGPEKSPAVTTRRLTSGTSLHATPRLSPDGKLVAFSRGNGETMNIFVLPVEGGEPRQLTFFKADNSGPAWSPDGARIAFGSNEGGNFRVWLMSAQGGGLRQFATTALSDSQQVVWAPGSPITYHKAGNRNFMVLDPATEEELPLVKDESVGWIFEPVYSPDGKKVAVNWNRQPAAGVWVISLDDSSEKLIRPGGSPLGWSPDGKWVYVLERGSGKSEYLMVDVESGKTRPLPTIPFTIDGETYHKIAGGRAEIFVAGKTQSDVWVIDNFDQIIK